MEVESLIGKPIPRVDGITKVTGRAAYCDDLRLRGLLYGKILRSPYSHAKILHLNTERAERIQGVRAVITAIDTPLVKYGIMIRDELPLARNKVRYIGDEVAAVAAVDEETAEEALRLIEVEYEPLDAVYEMDEAIDPSAPLIHEAERNIARHLEIERGDIEKGFEESDQIFEDEFSTNFVHTAPIEPWTCIAEYDPSGKFTFYIPLQEVGRSLPTIGMALNVPNSKIRVIQTEVGGGFGGKNGITPLTPITAFLAKKSGKPVKIVCARDEEFMTSRPALPMKIALKVGVKNDGRLMAKSTKIMANNGAYTSHGVTVSQAAMARFDSVYRQKNIKTELDLIYTNNVPTGAYRGYGANQTAFALESHMDLIAERLGMDPLDIRLRNATKKGDISVHGWNIKSCALEQCLEEASRASGWKDFKSKKPPNRGMGIASSIHICGLDYPILYSGSKIVLNIGDNGIVNILSGEGEVGQGANTVLTQIVAEQLEIPVEWIAVPELDTQYTPIGLGAFSSRVTITAGNAAKKAADEIKGKIIEIASVILQAHPSELKMAGGNIYHREDSSKSLSYSQFIDAANRSGMTPIIGIGRYKFEGGGYDPKTLFGDMSGTYSFAAHVAEVEVDPETGFITILNYFAAHDSGNIINPICAEGQVEGGVVQGIGYGVNEEILLSSGEIMNPGFMDYKIMKATGVPNIKVIFVQSEDPIGPFGAKGIGEEVSVPAPPAIANAVYDAIGVRIKNLPITPEKILRKLKNKI
jgi:CO/xanthine dehydrogenase Mo-binding subunit